MPLPIESRTEVRAHGDNRFEVQLIYPSHEYIRFKHDYHKGDLYLREIDASHYQIDIKWAFNHHPDKSFSTGALRLIEVYEAGHLGI